MSIWKKVKNRFRCEHEEMRLSKRITSGNGHVQYVEQCQTCGWCTSAIAHAKLTAAQQGGAPVVDPTISERWHEARRDYADSLQAMEERKREQGKNAWMRQYSQGYLRSPEWRAMRQKVLRRDGFVCQSCLRNKATQVHHVSYLYGKHTPAWLLQSVCNKCHETITAIDRGDLPARDFDVDSTIDELAY